MRDSQDVFVETAARLHFGVLDLRGANGRWFGGIGAAAPGPTLLVSARAAERLEAEGPDADRAHEYARRFVAHYGLRGGVRLRVHRALPAHSGLGSGTQMALSVGRAIAELHGIEIDSAGLARAVGRARRSAVGTWTFAGGGLVVEGGRQPGRDQGGPLLARLCFPDSWRCVVAVPESKTGISGEDEQAAFDSLPAPSVREVEGVAHLVLMSLLPAVADADIEAFGEALGRIQEITGRWFAPVQGGPFAPGASESLIRRMRDHGARGVGQSSWGPAVYGIVDGAEAGARLAGLLRASNDYPCEVYEGSFPRHGALVRRGHPGAPVV
jgi:beta-ribofuranosylaminobenzene 5'-phosphate synthase